MFQPEHKRSGSDDSMSSIRSRHDSIPITMRSSGPERFIGALDQGTTSSRFIIFNNFGQIQEMHQIDLKNYHDRESYVEQDPDDLLQDVTNCIEICVKKWLDKNPERKATDIESIGITNQRETTVVWEKNSGKALARTIVWSDTRTRQLVKEYEQKPGGDKFIERCGMRLSTYPSALKLRWLVENQTSVKTAYENGKLCFGTIDSWLVFRLNRGSYSHFVTDASNASRTLFMDIKTRQYARDLFEFFDLDMDKIILPKICPSSHPTAYGYIREGLLKGVPIGGVLGDQSAALVGHCAFEEGQAKSTYGTGAFVLLNQGSTPKFSNNGLITTVGYDFGEKGMAYAFEGSVAVAGSGLKYLANQFGFAADPIEICKLASEVTSCGSLIFVTAFSGLFAPYWVSDAKACLFNLDMSHSKSHVCRAAVESICFQSKAVLDTMKDEAGLVLTKLNVDGGVSNDAMAMQIQSNFLNMMVHRPKMSEVTALGAAIAAGLSVNIWRNLDHVSADLHDEGGRIFTPSLSSFDVEYKFECWNQAVEAVRFMSQPVTVNGLERQTIENMLSKSTKIHIHDDLDIPEEDEEDGLIMGTNPKANQPIMINRALARSRSGTASVMLPRVSSFTAIMSKAHSNTNLGQLGRSSSQHPDYFMQKYDQIQQELAEYKRKEAALCERELIVGEQLSELRIIQQRLGDRLSKDPNVYTAEKPVVSSRTLFWMNLAQSLFLFLAVLYLLLSSYNHGHSSWVQEL